MSLNLTAKQRLLGPRSFFLCVLSIDLVTILALDMYTPALPAMQREFGASAADLNSTVFFFLMLSAIVMLFAGTVSDRVGRKPLMVFGTVLFALASAGCVVAPDIATLIVLRCGQAIGYGISASIGPAMLKDAYDSDSSQIALSLMQSLVLLGPVLAPFLGSAMLMLMDWRGIFAFLAVFGVLSAISALLITETLPKEARSQESLGDSLRGMAQGARVLLAQPGFSSLNWYLALGGVPFFAFIAASAYIVQNEFGMGYLAYSLIYGGACLVNMVAPYAYLALSKRMNMTTIARLTTGLICASAVLLLTVAPLGPALLLVAFVPYALAEGIIRPASYVEMLDQRPTLVGTASAVSNFTYHAITALATIAATLAWSSMMFGLGVITALTAVVLVGLTLAFATGWNLRAVHAKELAE